MKKLLTLLFAILLIFESTAQESKVNTESVILDNLATFIIENFNVDSETQKNIIFLIESYASDFNVEDKIILKHALKLLSKRTEENDLVSIAFYSYLNGIALEQVKSNNLKKLLYTIEHPKQSVDTSKHDGIALAYEFAKENFEEDLDNLVVLVRIPNRKKANKYDNIADANNQQKKKNNSIVITAIALLPELIAVIKD